jgi:hypothetical protein
LGGLTEMARVFLAGIIILVFAFPLTAKNHLVADLDKCAEYATHIVVVTEGDKIDGQLEVLDSWKGDLQVGEKLTIPELAEFAPLETRAVQCMPTVSLCLFTHPQIYVSCSKMLLFLCQKKTSLSEVKEWSGIGEVDIIGAIVWMEKEGSYRFVDRYRKDKGILTHGGFSPESKMEGLIRTKIAEMNR